MEIIEKSAKSVQDEVMELLIFVDKVCKKHKISYTLAYGSVLGAIRHKGFIPWDTDVDIYVKMTEYTEFCMAIRDSESEKFMISYNKFDKDYEELFARVHKIGEAHHLCHIDVFPLAGAPTENFAKVIFSKIAYINYRSYFIKKVDTKVNYINKPRKRKLVNFLKIILKLIPAIVFENFFDILAYKYDVDKSEELINICGSYGWKEIIRADMIEQIVYKEFEGVDMPVPLKWNEYLTHMYGDYMTPVKY